MQKKIEQIGQHIN